MYRSTPAALLCSAQAVVDPRGLPLQRLRPQLRAPEPFFCSTSSALSRGCSSTASATAACVCPADSLGAGSCWTPLRQSASWKRLSTAPLYRRQGSSRGRRRGRGRLRNLLGGAGGGCQVVAELCSCWHAWRASTRGSAAATPPTRCAARR
jgi:hypothetical protein